LLKRSIRLVILELESYANNTEFTEFLYIQVDVGLSIFIIDKFQYFILSKVTSKDVVIVILEYLGVEVISGWHIDSVIKKKKTRRVSQLMIFGISKSLKFAKCFAAKVFFASIDQISRWSLSRSRIVAI